MKKFTILLLVISLVTLGCLQGPTQYVCPDGTVVSDPVECPPERMIYVCPDDTIVSDPAECPEMDLEHEGCLSLSGASQDGIPPRDFCLLDLAISRKNTTLCNEINFTTLMNNTRAYCGFQIANANNTPADCKNLSKAEEANKCIILYATDKADESVCELFPDDIYLMETCILSAIEASDTPDWELCDDMDLAYVRDDCYLAAAYKTLDVIYCNKMTKSAYNQARYACYSHLANSYGTPELCEEILDQNRKDNCYLTYVQYMGLVDSEICSYIEDDTLRAVCLRQS